MAQTQSTTTTTTTMTNNNTTLIPPIQHTFPSLEINTLNHTEDEDEEDEGATATTKHWLTEQLTRTTEVLEGIEHWKQRISNDCVGSDSNDSNHDDWEGGRRSGSTTKTTSPSEQPPPNLNHPTLVTNRLRAETDLLSLAHQYRRIFPTTSFSITPDTPFVPTAKIVFRLGLVLLRHTSSPPPSSSSSSSSSSSPVSESSPCGWESYHSSYRAITQRYYGLYQHTCAKGVLRLRNYLRSVAYPSPKGCRVVSNELDLFWEGLKRVRLGRGIRTRKSKNHHNPNEKEELRREVEKEEEDEEEGKEENEVFGVFDSDTDNTNTNGIAAVVWCLTHLHTLHRSVCSHTHTSPPTPNVGSRKNDRERIEVLDELVRPIVERVRYHFVDCDGCGGTSSSGPTPDGNALRGGGGEGRGKGGDGGGIGSGSDGGSDGVRFTSSRIECLPEWLFSYLRNLLLVESGPLGTIDETKENQTQRTYGVREILVHGVFPMFYAAAAIEQNRQERCCTDVCASSSSSSTTFPLLSSSSFSSSFSGVRTEAVYNACRYFWTEQFRLVRHVFLVRNFFRDPRIVGGGSATESSSLSSSSSSPVVLCRALEEILRFDTEVCEMRRNCCVVGERNGLYGMEEETELDKDSAAIDKKNNGGPYLFEILICSDEPIFRWWIETEKQQVVRVLHASFEDLILSEQQQEEEEERKKKKETKSFSLSNNNNNTTTTIGSKKSNPQLFVRDPTAFHPTAETCLVLLSALRMKSKFLSSSSLLSSSLVRFTSSTEQPLCLEFMELMNRDAAAARNELVEKKDVSAILVGADIGNGGAGGFLGRNLERWMSVVGATHAVGYCIEQRSRRTKKGLIAGEKEEIKDDGDDDDGGEWACTSLYKLRDAMVEEFGAAFVETSLMEKAKLASYLMRCPFLLTSGVEAAMGGGNVTTMEQEEEEGLRVFLSPGLVETARLLEITVRTCRGVVAAVVDEERRGVSVTDDRTTSVTDRATAIGAKYSHLLTYAPFRLQAVILRRLVDGLLEVVTDEGVVPVIDRSGANALRNDVGILLGFFLNKEDEKESEESAGGGVLESDEIVKAAVNRLMDIVELMAIDVVAWRRLRSDLLALVKKFGGAGGSCDEIDPFVSSDDGGIIIDSAVFENDASLYDRGRSILQAEGFHHVELIEAIGVMNRRKAEKIY